MEKSTRTAIERATQKARKLLEAEFADQLEGTFDILRDGHVGAGSSRMPAADLARRASILAALDRKRANGMDAKQAHADYLRDAAFTTLNRFVALKMLEARELLQECITRGEQSNGYGEFTGMAPGIALLPEGRGYRLYLESLFDELSTEIKVLFDRRDPATVLWPRRAAFAELLDVLNGPELAGIWAEDETIGWVYQYFNGADERKKMREESQAPRNSRELAVRNQFFTPRYVVQFLTDNTLGRTWMEMTGGRTRLTEQCEYFVKPVDEPLGHRVPKDPRDLKILDPACGSGHFLLYAFDLLLTIYKEGWALDEAPTSELTGRTLRADYPELSDLRAAAPGLIVEHNLYGVDIDARCAQIAALALWLRAQRAYRDLGIKPDARPRITRTHIVIAEPMPGDAGMAAEFAKDLQPPFVATLFLRMVQEMRLAGELGTLLQVEKSLADDIRKARQQYLASEQQELFPGLRPRMEQTRLDLSGVTDESVFHEAEQRILAALDRFSATSVGDVRHRLFAGDAGQGVSLVDLFLKRYDIVLMNPPFGAGSRGSKPDLERLYPATKNDVYAAFVERGVALLHSGGMLGAITSGTGFFISSFESWRKDVLLKHAPPLVFADLGYGVMDAALVEAAAYCLRKVSSPMQESALA